MKYLTIAILVLSLLIPFATTVAYAEDFSINISTEYVTQEDYLLVRETHVITNNSRNRYIPTGQTMSFFMDRYENTITSEEDILAMQLGTLQTSTGTYDVKKFDDYYEITLPFTKDLSTGQSQTFWIEYRDYQLSEHVGNLENIYIPKQTGSIESSYDVTRTFIVKIPSSKSDQVTYTIEPQEIKSDVSYMVLTYTYDQLDESSALIQIGKAQYYSFEITQQVPQTTQGKYFPTLPLNEVTLTLPREYDENHQQVYIKSITPEPTEVYTNSEGNVFARFLLAADSKHSIKIEGYITTSLDSASQPLPTSALTSQIPAEYTSLTQPAKYWESDSEAVQDAINEIPQSESVLQIIQNTYKYVVDHVDYDKSKYQDNARLGAENTLNGGPAVCMEYADTMIALLRAQGVPAIAAFGRGFNTNISPEEQQDHQWVLAYIPSYGWTTIDPTWGENGYYYIGPDINRVLWYTSSSEPNSTPPLTHLSMENPTLDLPKITFNPLSTPDLSEATQLKSYIKSHTANYNFWNKAYEQIRTGTLSRIIDQYLAYIFGFLVAVIIISAILEIAAQALRRARRPKLIVQPTSNPHENLSR